MLIGEKTLKLKRGEFLKACRVRGRNVRYFEPLDKYQPNIWNEWHDGHAKFKEFIVFDKNGRREDIRVLWHEHLNEWTLKRIGMIQALGTDHPIVECPHSMPIMGGGVFLIQSGINKSEWLPYRVALMRTVDENVISITAELAPILTGEIIQRPATEGKKEFYNIITDSEDED